MKILKLLIILILLISLIPISLAETINLRIYPKANPLWGWRARYVSDANLIELNGDYGEVENNNNLRHELQHYFCLKLFKNVDYEHNRCFND